VLGKPALTIARVRQQFRTASGVFSLLELELKTGRTHQIRVHLSHRGYSIVGDDMYGGKPLGTLDRQALHAATLAFRHPVDNRAMAFEAPLPVDMATALASLGSLDNLSVPQVPPGATVRLGPGG